MLQSPLRLKADSGAPFSLTPATPSLSYPTPVDLVADKAYTTVVIFSARRRMRSSRARTYDQPLHRTGIALQSVMHEFLNRVKS
jgi:hypothetical protein